MHKHSLVLLLAVFAVCMYAPLEGKSQIGTLDIKGVHLKFKGPILGFDMGMTVPVSNGGLGETSTYSDHHPSRQ